MNGHIPPFTETEEITKLVGIISEVVHHLHATLEDMPSPQLRKKNRIKTIQSSLAIENNSLSVEQVTAIIEGKKVLGAPNEITEVKNAIDAYKLLFELNPFDKRDLLRAHQLMMKDLVNENGRFRSGNVGVFGNQGLVHLAPPALRVPTLISDLFHWIKTTKTHPLISSCVFHYEFEFIHPFADGNGRMGRLWQTLLLMQWNPIFAWLPVETIIKEYQQEYYDAIALSDKQGNSTSFITFMLNCLLLSLQEIEHKETVDIVENIVEKLSTTQGNIVRHMAQKPSISARELAEKLSIAPRNIQVHIKKLQEQGIIRRVGPDKGGHWEIIKE